MTTMCFKDGNNLTITTEQSILKRRFTFQEIEIINQAYFVQARLEHYTVLIGKRGINIRHT